MSTRYSWSRWSGYECSSRGDRRFSALYACMPDGRTIEEHYQCDVKGHNPGGTNWRDYKGLPPKPQTVDLWTSYLDLWRRWAAVNTTLMAVLKRHADAHDGVLSDCFARTPINQAAALAALLNEQL